MDKNLILVFVIAAVMGGAIWYQHRPTATPAPSLASALAAATGKATGSSPAAVPGKPAADADTVKKQAAARAEIEKALVSMKITSILLGDPAIVIINKTDYSVGSPLALPGGKTLQITRIDEGGVTLAGGAETFHLDAPGAPDLAASRKKL